MKQFTAIAIDDEPHVLNDTWQILLRIPNVKPLQKFTNIPDALAYLQEIGWVDMVFCDIQLPRLYGLKGRHLFSPFCELFVFITGYDAYAKPAFQVYPDGCLFKPIDEEDVLPLLNKLAARRAKPSTGTMGHPYINAKNLMVYNDSEKDWRAVPIAEINRLSVSGDFVQIFAPELVGLPKMTLTEAEEMLRPTGAFIRISQSHMVAYDAIERTGNSVVYVGGEAFNVTKMGKVAFDEYFAHFSLSSRKHASAQSG